MQVIPHVTDCIQEWIEKSANNVDNPEICVIELGGTVGDIESMPFVEALRQLKYVFSFSSPPLPGFPPLFLSDSPLLTGNNPCVCVFALGFSFLVATARYRVGEENFCSIFVSLVPQLGVVGEQKTKPTQHGVKNLTSMGLGPEIIVCRSEQPLLEETKKKLGLFCQVSPEAVVSVYDVNNTYNIPLMLQQQGKPQQSLSTHFTAPVAIAYYLFAVALDACLVCAFVGRQV